MKKFISTLTSIAMSASLTAGALAVPFAGSALTYDKTYKTLTIESEKTTISASEIAAGDVTVKCDVYFEETPDTDGLSDTASITAMMTCEGDTVKMDSIDKLFADTEEKYGKIDILVNNAANVGLKDGRVDELTLEMWDAIFQSDMRGTFYTTKVALPYLQKNPEGGSIINIGSMASCAGDLGSTAYACAKAGVNMLTQSVATQYGKQKIRCNCVRPGLIVTPQNEAHVPQVLKDIFLSNIMVDRYGCPEDIGHLCVYLASDESCYVTGQIINVDGGLNSHVPTVAQFRELNSRTW